MSVHTDPSSQFWTVALFVLASAVALGAQDAPRFTGIELKADGEVLLHIDAPADHYYRIDASSQLPDWSPLATLLSAGSDEHGDSATPFISHRFYRAELVSGTNVLTGDHLATTEGEVIIHPVNHASFVMSWQGKMIYNDAVGASSAYAGIPKADLLLVSHGHGDHFSASTIAAMRGPEGVIVASQAVYNSLSTALKASTIVLMNGSSTNIMGISVEAVPAYNANHPVGVGNGYVLTIGGKRIYMSGDTGATPEMRALQNIDVAFIAMNVPFTMSVDQAAGAIREFRPKVVYPYHYRNQNGSFADFNDLKQLVGQDLGIEIRLRDWY